jgi:beta-galactosidase
VEWKVRYEPGTITAHGWKDGKLALTEERTTTGPAVALRLKAERTEIDADGEDLSVLTVSAVDSQGRAVPTADVLVDFKVMGEGALIGVGNGDPNCQESDKEPRRSLFNGLAQAIVQSTKTAGTIEIVAEVNVRHVNLEPAKIVITAKQVKLRPAV